MITAPPAVTYASPTEALVVAGILLAVLAYAVLVTLALSWIHGRRDRG